MGQNIRSAMRSGEQAATDSELRRARKPDRRHWPFLRQIPISTAILRSYPACNRPSRRATKSSASSRAAQSTKLCSDVILGVGQWWSETETARASGDPTSGSLTTILHVHDLDKAGLDNKLASRLEHFLRPSQIFFFKRESMPAQQDKKLILVRGEPFAWLVSASHLMLRTTPARGNVFVDVSLTECDVSLSYKHTQ